MSKLDMLRSHLLNRMSAVIREIFEEVEVTVKDYREEADRTRTENAKLKRQLRDVLIRTEKHLNELPTGGSGYQKETEDQETLQTKDHGQSPDSFSDEKPCLRDFISMSKTDSEDMESVHLKESSSISSLSSMEEQQLVSQGIDKRWNANLPTDTIKTEQDDTIITITSSVITAPAGQCHGSDTTHQLRTGCDTSTTLNKAQRKELHCTRHSTTIADSRDRNGPYKCNKCGRLLKDLTKLQLHRKLHERSFSCHWCGRDFSKVDYLRMHMRTHTGERPYRCNWCSKTFTQCGNMRRHERTCQMFTK
ncbi:uncharacterized protein [Misgurnus anguillicaudatus]|uniref:uncharacterized protein isoform X2 n=1 Tax=Misgurnus anguillicaudatus TaxID=75329 RepID=UPI003CCF6756